MTDAERAIRERDANFGPDLPEHYTGPRDRRYLLKVIDELRARDGIVGGLRKGHKSYPLGLG